MYKESRPFESQISHNLFYYFFPVWLLRINDPQKHKDLYTHGIKITSYNSHVYTTLCFFADY